GANTLEELHDLERACQRARAIRMVNSGVRIADVNRIDIRGNLESGKGTFIDVNNVFEGDVVLGRGVSIGPNCYIRDSKIEDGVVVKANTVIEDSKIGASCSLGPFTRVRGRTNLESFSELGNFVEANRTSIGRFSKAKHLTYLGDATLGEGVNVGAGTITCNYDGTKKHKTKMADGVFIGSNTSLVAPITLGEGAYTGAGSVITKNVPKDSLAIGRARQSKPIKKEKNR
nr:bifunctional UDP-N-acetylglucosamine diphosphorylase/glucosamine-1-phosphate N-acetyltransferase GlmU [Dehalococcoidia bacterium]